MPKTTKLSIKTLLGSNQQRLAWKRVKRRNLLIITIRKCDNSVYVFVLQCLLYRLETFYQYVQKSCRDDVSIMLKNNIYCKSATLTWHHNIKPSFVFLSFSLFVFLSKFKMITHSLTDLPRSDISSQQRGQLKRKLKMGKLEREQATSRRLSSQIWEAKKIGQAMFEKEDRRNRMEKVDICVSGYREQGRRWTQLERSAFIHIAFLSPTLFASKCTLCTSVQCIVHNAKGRLQCSERREKGEQCLLRLTELPTRLVTFSNPLSQKSPRWPFSQ